VKIHQHTELFLASLPKDSRLEFRLQPGRRGWLQVTRGAVGLKSTLLDAGDGAAISDENILDISAGKDAEVLFFDLP